MSSFRINRGGPVLGTILALALLALSTPEPATAGSAVCDAINSGWCCECIPDDCIEVEHDGVADCAPEYCSETECEVEP